MKLISNICIAQKVWKNQNKVKQSSQGYCKTSNFREHLIFSQICEGVGQGG